MKKRTLIVGTIAVTAVVAGGWALAGSVGPPGGFGPPFMRGQGHGGARMMKGMHGRGHDGMGPGMMKGMGGHGPAMMKGKDPGMRSPQGASPDADSVRE
jgi:hypothetical protein